MQKLLFMRSKIISEKTDFYASENAQSEKTSYLEFGASKPERLKALREIIGKHVYTQANADTGMTSLVVE